MSFRFGDLDTSTVEGVTATLKSWPSLTLSPETVELLDGAFYARTGYGSLTFEFDVLLSAPTPAAVHALRDLLVGACAPTGGLQALIPETGDGWRWWAACASLPKWERGLWIGGVECQLRGVVAFTVPDGVGWAYPDRSASAPAAASASVTITPAGNLAAHPTLTVGGVAPGGVRLTVGAWVLDVSTPIALGQTLVLDYGGRDFGVWKGGIKVAHAAPGMSHFRRLALTPQHAHTVQAAPLAGGSVSLTIAANSRKG